MHKYFSTSRVNEQYVRSAYIPFQATSEFNFRIQIRLWSWILQYGNTVWQIRRKILHTIFIPFLYNFHTIFIHYSYKVFSFSFSWSKCIPYINLINLVIQILIWFPKSPTLSFYLFDSCGARSILEGDSKLEVGWGEGGARAQKWLTGWRVSPAEWAPQHPDQVHLVYSNLSRVTTCGPESRWP